MRDKSLRRTTWFLLCIPLGDACGGRSQCRPFQQPVLEGDLRAGGRRCYRHPVWSYATFGLHPTTTSCSGPCRFRCLKQMMARDISVFLPNPVHLPIMPFMEWEEDEVALSCHTAYAEQGAVVTRVHFGRRLVTFCHREKGNDSCWLSGLHAL